MIKIIKITLICFFVQSCVASKNYEKTSLNNRDKIYESLIRSDQKIKIYLQNAEKREIEKDYNNTISVSPYCYSHGDIYMGGRVNSIWETVEKKAFQLGIENNSPILFVCSPKNADFIYEYSYLESKEGSAMANFLSVMSLFILPMISQNDYEVSLKIKNKNNKIIKDLGITNLSHKVYTTPVLIPVQIITGINPTKENVIADIVLDKIIESLPILKN